MRIFCDHFDDAPGELKPEVGPEFGPDGLGGRAGNASSYIMSCWSCVLGSWRSVNAWDDEGPGSISHEPSRYSTSTVFPLKIRPGFATLVAPVYRLKFVLVG